MSATLSASTLLAVPLAPLVGSTVAGLFGTKAHMARIAGRGISVAKSAAARANGAKGGRPRKAV